MSIDANEYARLSSDSYNDRSADKTSNKTVTVGGIDYKILDVANDPKTGYQGTAYQRMGSNEVIIAHRGTEPNAKDIKADAGMVFTGRNSQLDEAIRFTERATAIARKIADEKHQPLSVSITGHSLGGTMAEITAARYGVHAETFNAYGPGALTDLERYGVDVHAKHPHIVNHVRATDVVGAGGPHLGQVKIYAAPQDIENLRRGRYVGGSLLPANPLLAADVSAHSITNFLPSNKTLGGSAMSPINEAQARAYAGPIAQYRHDVMQGRIDLHMMASSAAALTPIPTVSGLRLGVQAADAVGTVAAEKAGQTVMWGAQVTGQGANAVGHAAGQAYDGTRGAVNAGAQRAGKALEQTGEAIRDGASRAIEKFPRPSLWLGSQADTIPLLNHPEHPGHGLYKQASTGLEKINAERGISSDQRTCNAAGTLATAACHAGFKQIDHVALNDNGSMLIAVQGTPGTAHSKVIDVQTVAALSTPIEDSSTAYLSAMSMNQAAQQPIQHPAQTQAQAQPAMTRFA